MSTTQACRITLCALVAACLILFPDGFALAQSTDPFATANAKLQSAQSGITMTVSLIGFLGLCGLVVLAYFNRFQWKWAFSLIGGFVLLAMASVIIKYLTSTGSTGFGI
jgi:type IV secretory pathway VirB2 component (pilin)